MGVVHFFVHKVHFLEKYILGLNYEIRGQEHLPKDEAFIVAAKHQSPYETLKLHVIFDDPAVILKQELLKIPLWGKYLEKSAPIAIDRSNKELAVSSIQDGAKRVQKEGRPIVIFPQGTRVNIDQTSKDKPYKVGVTRIQDATGLPIIPLALNAGVFWPRSGWLKSPGTVIFEFLEPIEAGQDKAKVMSELEDKTETKSNELIAEAREKHSAKKTSWLKNTALGLPILLLLAFASYAYWWHKVADEIRDGYVENLVQSGLDESQISPIEISGFPGKITATVTEQIFKDNKTSIKISDIKAQSWPFPFMPIAFQTGALEIKNIRWADSLNFESLEGSLTPEQDKVTLHEAHLKQDKFVASLSGVVETQADPISNLDLNLRLKNHSELLRTLGAQKIIDTRIALFLGTGLASLADKDGTVNIPIYKKGNMIHAGPFPVMSLSQFQRPEPSASGSRTLLRPSP